MLEEALIIVPFSANIRKITDRERVYSPGSGNSYLREDLFALLTNRIRDRGRY